MRNTGLKEAPAGIKIARRNINNLRYADDTTFMAESEELKSLLIKVKEEAPRHREGRTLYPRAAPPGSGCLPPETAARASLAPTPVAARGAWQEAAAAPLGAQPDAWVIREPSPRWVFRNW